MRLQCRVALACEIAPDEITVVATSNNITSHNTEILLAYIIEQIYSTPNATIFTERKLYPCKTPMYWQKHTEKQTQIASKISVPSPKCVDPECANPRFGVGAPWKVCVVERRRERERDREGGHTHRNFGTHFLLPRAELFGGMRSSRHQTRVSLTGRSFGANGRPLCCHTCGEIFLETRMNCEFIFSSVCELKEFLKSILQKDWKGGSRSHANALQIRSKRSSIVR